MNARPLRRRRGRAWRQSRGRKVGRSLIWNDLGKPAHSSGGESSGPGPRSKAGSRARAPRYEGDSSARDAVYHQGTVWPWLIGPLVDAWVRVRGNTSAARRDARARFVDPLRSQVQTSGLGHLAEIADAEAPFALKGCPFQAWSLGELLRLDRVVLAEPKRAARTGKEAQQMV